MKAAAIPLALLGFLLFLTGWGGPFGIPAPAASYSSPIKEIALTFDDGPSPDTPLILKVLKDANVKAAFFTVGEHVRRYPEFVRQASAQGEEIENHSWSHPHLVFHSSGFVRRQLEDTNALLEKLTGKRPEFFRPPYGQYDLDTLSAVRQAGLRPVVWSVTGYDWLLPGAPRIQKNVLEGLKPGAVILLHDGGGDRRQTVQALLGIIPAAEREGYRFVLLRDMQGLPRVF